MLQINSFVIIKAETTEEALVAHFVGNFMKQSLDETNTESSAKADLTLSIIVLVTLTTILTWQLEVTRPL